jgi:hypothetical protein
VFKRLRDFLVDCCIVLAFGGTGYFLVAMVAS